MISVPFSLIVRWTFVNVILNLQYPNTTSLSSCQKNNSIYGTAFKTAFAKYFCQHFSDIAYTLAVQSN